MRKAVDPEPARELTLEAVLDHYGADYTSRTKQAISCLLHEDQTPSCSINLDKAAFNCKSCGEAGGPYQLIMAKEDCDYREARQFVADFIVTEGGTGGGSQSLRSSSDGFGRGRGVAGESRDKSFNRPYLQAWTRR